MMKKILLVMLIFLSIFSIGCENKKTNVKPSVANQKSVSADKLKNSTASSSNNVEVSKPETKDNQSTTNQETKINQISYKKYINTRFEFSIEYPSSFVIKLVPDNNDGRIFSSQDGNTELTVSGINNVLNETPSSVYNDTLKEHNNASYKKLQNNWFIVSWIEGDKIVYQKSIVGKGSTNTFIFKYPSNKKSYYDSIIEHLIFSFKTPEINSAH